MSSGGKIENILELENLQCSEIRQRSIQGHQPLCICLECLQKRTWSDTKKITQRTQKHEVDTPILSKFYIHTYTHMGFPGGSDGKESACNAGTLGSIPGLGRSPGGGHGNPLQYSCLENPHGQRSLVGYSPRGRKESDTTERLSTHITHTQMHTHTRKCAHKHIHKHIHRYTCTQTYMHTHTHIQT